MIVSVAGCITPKAPKRLAQSTPITVAYLVQRPGGWSTEVPEGFAEAQTRALERRNLAARPVTPDGATRIAGASLTGARIASLAAASSSDMIALVEASTRYDSVLAGRYRWTVFAKVTVADRRDTSRAVTRSFDVPVILEYDHEEATEALVDAADAVSAELGKVVDSYVASYGSGGAPPAPTGAAPGATSAAPYDAIYMILVDRFHNGNRANDDGVDRGDPQGWHGGDLAGVTAKLDYIKGLGFNAVWLTPITDARRDKFHGHGAYHGYWTTELGGLNPMFGTASELDALRDGLARRGMKLVFDLVLNHVGPGAEMARQRPDWFHNRGRIENWTDPVEVTTGDVHGLPDLDQDNPEVYRYLLDHSVKWLSRARPAAFRMDAVRHIEPQFWRRFLPELRDRADGVQMIGEIFDGHPAAIAGGFELGFDQLFDFPMYFATREVFCDEKPMTELAAALSVDRAYPDASRLVTFADNHDLPRLASVCPEMRARENLLFFLLSIRGVPSVTYGTEVGLAGLKEPDNRASMRFGPLDRSGELIAELLARRREHPSLRTTRRQIVEISDDRLVWRQRAGGETAELTISRDGRPTVKFSDEPLAPSRPVELRWRGRGFPPGTPAIVGNVPELGIWTEPRTGSTVTVPSGEVIAFKLAVRKPDGSIATESGPNRTLLVTGDPPELELSWHK
jgi:glycosidase